MRKGWKVVCKHGSKKWEMKLGHNKGTDGKHYFWTCLPTIVDQFGMMAEEDTPMEEILEEFAKFLTEKISTNTVFKNWKVTFERIKEEEE